MHLITDCKISGAKTEKTYKEKQTNPLLQFRDFNTPLSAIDRFSKQKISNDTPKLNSTINQLDVIDIY